MSDCIVVGGARQGVSARRWLSWWAINVGVARRDPRPRCSCRDLSSSLKQKQPALLQTFQKLEYIAIIISPWP